MVRLVRLYALCCRFILRMILILKQLIMLMINRYSMVIGEWSLSSLYLIQDLHKLQYSRDIEFEQLITTKVITPAGENCSSNNLAYLLRVHHTIRLNDFSGSVRKYFCFRYLFDNPDRAFLQGQGKIVFQILQQGISQSGYIKGRFFRIGGKSFFRCLSEVFENSAGC